jgi:hypothetical protein
MDERMLVLRSQEPESRRQEAAESWVNALRWGRLSNGTYGTHGTYGTYGGTFHESYKSLSASDPPLRVSRTAESFLLAPGFWLLMLDVTTRLRYAR